jgi:hypothetical protein
MEKPAEVMNAIEKKTNRTVLKSRVPRGVIAKAVNNDSPPVINQ